MAEESDLPIRVMNFVSEEQLVEAKKTRGERVDDGTAQRDRPLYEILRENKDKRDAEFNERFKHRPPKSLDEDETEFLDNLETTKREYERQVADEEAQQIRSFQAAVAAQSNIVHELKERTPLPVVQEEKPAGKKNPASRPLGMIIKVKPQAKKAKLDEGNAEEASKAGSTPENDKPPMTLHAYIQGGRNIHVQGGLERCRKWGNAISSQEGACMKDLKQDNKVPHPFGNLSSIAPPDKGSG